MKILLRILAAIGIIIVLVLIVAAFTKKEYSLETEIIINRPRQEVYDYVRHFSNQPAYSPWLRLDPASKIGMRGTDGEQGAVFTWESEKIGQGEQEIIALNEPSQITYAITFIKPFAGKATNIQYFDEPAPGQTRLRNTFSSSMPYPMNIMLLCMDMNKTIGKELNNGNNNLKEVLEKR
jgi:hypothetical protein